jgi:hypothetical protein
MFIKIKIMCLLYWNVWKKLLILILILGLYQTASFSITFIYLLRSWRILRAINMELAYNT